MPSIPSIPSIPWTGGSGEPGHDMLQEEWRAGSFSAGEALLHPSCHSSSFPLPHKESGFQIRTKE